MVVGDHHHRNVYHAIGGNSLMILPGTPTTSELSGIFFVTTAPAPMVTLQPIVKLGRIVAFEPIWE
jgi:hypothetical protein